MQNLHKIFKVMIKHKLISKQRSLRKLLPVPVPENGCSVKHAEITLNLYGGALKYEKPKHVNLRNFTKYKLPEAAFN